MKRSAFLKTLAMSFTPSLFATAPKNHVRLIRHATLVMQIGNIKILVDPMLSAKDALDPVQNCGNDTRIPMVDLPFNEGDLEQLLSGIDAVIVTHLHRDHWDVAAQGRIAKEKMIFCQPGDEVKLKEQGFQKVTPVEDRFFWEGIMFHRVDGQHGTGEIGKKMGPVSGFVLKTKEQSVYVAGDTIWCDPVQKALDKFKPAITILNTGGAKFLTGDPITMTPSDVARVHEHLPSTKIIAVHMNTVNHCFVKRADLAQAAEASGLKIMIPEDGDTIEI